MNPKELSDLLTLMAARDGRPVGQVELIAWHEDLGRWDFETAREAVRRHYAISRDRARPYDVIFHIKKIRGERLDAYGPIIPPDELADSPLQARLWVLGRRDAIASGRVTPEPSTEASTEQIPAGNARMRELIAKVAATTAIPAEDAPHAAEVAPLSPTLDGEAARAIEEERRRQLESLRALGGGPTP